jgi:hypothetical protein
MYVNQWRCHRSSEIGPNPTVTLRSKWKVLGITLLSIITDFERLLPRGRRSIVVVVRSGGYTDTPSWSALYFAEISGFTTLGPSIKIVL